MKSFPISLEKIAPELPEERKLFLIGSDHCLVLYKQYDPDQFWLSFMVGCIFSPPDPPPPPPKPWTARQYTNAITRQFVTVPAENRSFYRGYDPIEQLYLPFREGRRIGSKLGKRLGEANWPGFGRTASGHLFTCDFPAYDQQRVDGWCVENCTGRFRVNKTGAVFELEIDAVCAKLVFHRPHTARNGF